MLYLILGSWQVPWSFCIWHGKGTASPPQLACKLLAHVPKTLTKRFTVIVLADTELGTVEFLTAVRKRHWRAVVGMRCTRLMDTGKPLKSLYRRGTREQQVRLVGMEMPLTVSWFWLKRSEGKRELRFVVPTPYSGRANLRSRKKIYTLYLASRHYLMLNEDSSLWILSGDN